MYLALALWMAADVASHAEKALQLQQAGQYQAAIAEYREALKQDARQPGILTNLGAALAHEGDFAAAIQSYQEAVRIDPEFGEARLNLGLAYYKLLRWSYAATEFSKYRGRNLNDLRSAMLLGDCYLELGEYKKTIGILSPFEREHPDNLGIAYILGTAYIRDKQEEPGKQLIARILAKGDVPEVHMMMGDAYVLAHQRKEAVEEYRSALARNPTLPLAHLRIAETTLAMGDLDGSLADLEAEYAVNPHNFDLNFYLGYLHKQKGAPEKARGFLERAEAMRPDTYQPNFQLALLADQRGDYAEARSRLERAVAQSPGEVEAHVVLARLYYRLGLKDQGKREQESIVRLNAAKQKKALAEHAAVPQP